MDTSNRDGGLNPDLSGLSAWAHDLAEAFVCLASDIALVVGTDGIVHEVVQAREEAVAPWANEWVGRPWAETVTGDTRGKVIKLLEEVRETGRGRRREVNHPAGGAGQIPVAYTALALGSAGPVLAVGRDLRSVAAIQHKFLEAQRDLEMGYWRAKRADARYRLLFEAATDAVLLVDGARFQIVECNEAAASLFDLPIEGIVGRAATFGFERLSRVALDELLAASLRSGAQSEIGARLMHRPGRSSVAVTPLRVDGDLFLMMRVREGDAATVGSELNEAIARLVEESTDSVVVTDSVGRVVVANQAFRRLLRLSADDAVRGRFLSDWMSVGGRTWYGFIEDVRQRRVVRHVLASVVLQTAGVVRVRVTATSLTEGDQERIGFTLHQVAVSSSDGLEDAAAQLQSQIDSLVFRVGGQPMPVLLRQTEKVLERFLIARALELSHGDRMRAAELLGVDSVCIERAAELQPESD